MKTTIRIRQGRNGSSVGIVYARGYAYAVRSADDLTDELVRELWRTKRRLFGPYDEGTDCFIERGR